jgi:hypothetical protein
MATTRHAASGASAESGIRLVARQQGETSARQRGDRAEVTFVECQQPPGPEPVREKHHRKVSQPKIKVGVLLIQPGHGTVLSRGQSLDPEPAGRDIAQERASFRAPPPGRVRSTRSPLRSAIVRRTWAEGASGEVAAFFFTLAATNEPRGPGHAHLKQ